jgi:hypothetical protein
VFDPPFSVYFSHGRTFGDPELTARSICRSTAKKDFLSY